MEIYSLPNISILNGNISILNRDILSKIFGYFNEISDIIKLLKVSKQFCKTLFSGIFVIFWSDEKKIKIFIKAHELKNKFLTNLLMAKCLDYSTAFKIISMNINILLLHKIMLLACQEGDYKTFIALFIFDCRNFTIPYTEKILCCYRIACENNNTKIIELFKKSKYSLMIR